MSEIFRRFRSMGEGEKLAEDGKIRLLASTDDAVDWGGWREVLSHAEGAIEMGAARSLLVNHDPDQLAGGISGMQTDGRQLFSDAEIDEDARMRSGVSVRKQVAKGRLNGVSIGYTYARSDTEFNEETRTMTVRKWRLLEVSLTPIPADSRAQVRSLPFAAEPKSPDVTETAAPAATQNERTAMSDPIKPQENVPAVLPINDEGARAAVMAENREIAVLAESVGLRASDYVGKPKAVAQQEMLLARAAKDKTPEPVVAVTQVRVDQADKAGDAFTAAIAHRAGFRSGAFGEAQKSNPLVGQGLQHAIRGYARLMGLDTSDWSNADTAYFAMGRSHLMSHGARDASVMSSSFPNFVFLNSISKVVGKGFEQGSSTAQYKRIVETQTVTDFRSFTIGGLAAGNLAQTAEGVAFPELTKTEGAYSSTAKMWGGTLTLTLQAMVNDDTAQFDRVLRQAGGLLDKTIDRRVFQRLLCGTSAVDGTATWTSNTSSGGSLVYTTADLAAAARGKLAIVRAAMMNKVGLDGNPLGNMPKFLVCGPTREMEARGIVGGSGPLLTAGEAQTTAGLEVIATPWLEASALTGSSTTSYYLLADPGTATGLVLSKVQGFEGIQVQPYDSGAVAAMNWKMWSPFECDLFWVTVGASTKVIPAAQQGTT